MSMESVHMKAVILFRRFLLVIEKVFCVCDNVIIDKKHLRGIEIYNITESVNFSFLLTFKWREINRYFFGHCSALRAYQDPHNRNLGALTLKGEN